MSEHCEEHEHEHQHTYTHTHPHEHEGGAEHEHAHEHSHTYSHSHPHEHHGEAGHTHSHPEEDAAHHHHDHEHPHDHAHPHTHEHSGKPVEELVALMKYMAGHNASHTRELEGLAGEVRASGHEASYEQIMEAVRFFDQGNEVLGKALETFLAE